MKIVVTGSLGRIGKPLTQHLVRQKHTVTVVSSNPVRSSKIEELGAIPAIGKLQEVNFLTSAFKGSDAVFTLVPPANYFDQDLDLLGYFQKLGIAFKKAVQRAAVKRVVNLSSIGAHLDEGNGILKGTYHVENSLNDLPEDVAITHVRPTEIYYNLFQFIDVIKREGVIANNCDQSDINVWVSTKDIARVVAEEISKLSSGRNVRYVAGEELTYKEVANILGMAIVRPDLKWVTIADEQMKNSLINIGTQPKIASEMVEMYGAISSGLLYEHYRLNKPETFGRVKMKDFAQDFADVYKKSKSMSNRNE